MCFFSRIHLTLTKTRHRYAPEKGYRGTETHLILFLGTACPGLSPNPILAGRSLAIARDRESPFFTSFHSGMTDLDIGSSIFARGAAAGCLRSAPIFLYVKLTYRPLGHRSCC
jgi:hypothetical protein